MATIVVNDVPLSTNFVGSSCHGDIIYDDDNCLILHFVFAKIKRTHGRWRQVEVQEMGMEVGVVLYGLWIFALMVFS